MTERGIDVSKWQGTIDWKQVADSGIAFAMIRAGSALNEDPMFQYNIKNARRAGIRVGIYWFSYAWNSDRAIEEANKCLEVLNGASWDKIDFPIFYDFEYDTEKKAKENHDVVFTKKLRADVCRAFCETIVSNGFRAGLYFNLDYLTSRIDYNQLREYPLWYAQWGQNTRKDNDFIMWQYSDSGKVPGITGKVDLNFYYREDPVEVPAIHFDDAHDWSIDAIHWAIAEGILRGDENGDLMLSKACTREELVTMLYRFAHR